MRSSSSRRARTRRSICCEQVGASDAAGDLFARQIAKAQAKVVDAISGAGTVVFEQALGGLFNLGDGVGIEQFAEVGIAQQFAQLILIDGESLGATFGQRSVSVIEEIGHIAEQQRGSEGRRLAGVDHMDAELALFDGPQGFKQRRHVEYVAQAFAIGLEQHRKRWIARSHAQQVVGAFAQLPQRGAGIGAAARKEQCSSGGFAKSPGKERRGPKLA